MTNIDIITIVCQKEKIYAMDVYFCLLCIYIYIHIISISISKII